MWKKLIQIFLIISVTCNRASVSSGIKDSKDNIPQFVDNSLDHIHHAAESRSSVQPARSTSTERPLIRYWNNLVRNIRLPVPRITWNSVNPLAGLLSEGASYVIESPVTNWSPSKSSDSTSATPRPSSDNFEQQSSIIRRTAGPRSEDIYYFDPYTRQYYLVVQYVYGRPYFEQHLEAQKVTTTRPKVVKKVEKPKVPPVIDESVAVVEDFDAEDDWRNVNPAIEMKVVIKK